jgi:hypothetical protein
MIAAERVAAVDHHVADAERAHALKIGVLWARVVVNARPRHDARLWEFMATWQSLGSEAGA